jgi:hypothetical protein
MLTPENKAVIYARADQKMRGDVNLSWRDAIVAEVESEVRKQDDALIRQMLDALKNTHDVGCNQTDAAITAANKRLNP